MARTSKKARAKPRRARGTGSIFFNEKKNRWIGRMVTGRTSSGKTLYREFWGETQREVVEKMKTAKPLSGDSTVATYGTRWLDTLSVRESTKDDYSHSFKTWISPTLGHRRIADVAPSDIERAAKTWAEKGLGANTIRKTLSHFRIMLGTAERDGIINKNPVSLAKKPKAETVDIQPFTPPELVRIIEESGTYTPGLIVGCMAGIGCRIGEALALDVTDFDARAGTVNITKTYSLDYGTGPTKSPHSVRTLRVPKSVLPILCDAIGSRTTGPIFVTRTGKRHGPATARVAWVVVLRRIGLPFRNLHQLRHSVATALISASVPLGDVAKFMGDTVATVVKTYLHPSQTDPTDTLDKLLGGRKVGDGKIKTEITQETKGISTTL